jgi:ABC-type transport system substrate-binding protein
MIFLNDLEPMLDPNVRMAAAHAIDKQTDHRPPALGLRRPIDTLADAEYEAYDASITVPTTRRRRAAPGRLGLRPDNPVRFTIQTTRGFKPKDYEMIQAVVGLWRRVGIEAEIEVYEIAKHYELRAADQLAPRLLQLGQLGRRPHDLHGLRDVRPLAPLRSGTAGAHRHDRPPLGEATRQRASRAGRPWTATSPRTRW